MIEASGVELVAGVDLDAKRLQDFGERWGINGLYSDIEEMMKHARPDIVSVTTPNDENLDLNIDEISVNRIPSFIGKTIKQTNIRDNYDLMIVCIIKDDNSIIINPKSDHIIEKNDTIMVIGDKEKLDKFSSKQTS